MGTWYYRAIVKSGDCSSAYSNEFAVIVYPATKGLNIKLFLEGLYAGNGRMNQAMGAAGPQFNDGIADTIRLELHNASSPYGVVYAFGNLNLHIDGTINALIPGNIISSYYLVVKHRNSMETWSSNIIDFSENNPVNYDFTTSADKAYGGIMKLMPGNVYAFYAGDVTQDGLIDGSDLSALDNAIIAVQVGYYPEDINGDGHVDGADMAIIDNNSLAVVFVRRPW